MIDVTKEDMFPFQKVPSWCEKHIGKRVHPSTAHRWRIRGVRGVKLESVLAGGARCTSHEAMLRFLKNSTAAADGEPLEVSSPVVDQREIEEAEKLLNQEGI